MRRIAGGLLKTGAEVAQALTAVASVTCRSGPMTDAHFNAQLSGMANIKRPLDQAGGTPIGSRQGGARDAGKETDLNEVGRPHKARAKLIDDPNRNQAGNDRGSQDNTQGS